MVTLIRSLFPNDAALSPVKLGKQKTTNIIRQVLGFDYLKEMVSLLRSRKFGIIIDEAEDKSNLLLLLRFLMLRNLKSNTGC